jgi:hypothetical protein
MQYYLSSLVYCNFHLLSFMLISFTFILSCSYIKFTIHYCSYLYLMRMDKVYRTFPFAAAPIM